ncbi:hypothetical protein GGF31_007641 [Allomyces arbusculus]|nr:hypothetical protein GGF31_007641 [Allomyces arbusculus]
MAAANLPATANGAGTDSAADLHDLDAHLDDRLQTLVDAGTLAAIYVFHAPRIAAPSFIKPSSDFARDYMARSPLDLWSERDRVEPNLVPHGTMHEGVFVPFPPSGIPARRAAASAAASSAATPAESATTTTPVRMTPQSSANTSVDDLSRRTGESPAPLARRPDASRISTDALWPTSSSAARPNGTSAPMSANGSRGATPLLPSEQRRGGARASAPAPTTRPTDPLSRPSSTRPPTGTASRGLAALNGPARPAPPTLTRAAALDLCASLAVDVPAEPLDLPPAPLSPPVVEQDTSATCFFPKDMSVTAFFQDLANQPRARERDQGVRSSRLPTPPRKAGAAAPELVSADEKKGLEPPSGVASAAVTDAAAPRVPQGPPPPPLPQGGAGEDEDHDDAEPMELDDLETPAVPDMKPKFNPTATQSLGVLDTKPAFEPPTARSPVPTPAAMPGPARHSAPVRSNLSSVPTPAPPPAPMPLPTHTTLPPASAVPPPARPPPRHHLPAPSSPRKRPRSLTPPPPSRTRTGTGSEVEEGAITDSAPPPPPTRGRAPKRPTTDYRSSTSRSRSVSQSPPPVRSPVRDRRDRERERERERMGEDRWRRKWGSPMSPSSSSRELSKMDAREWNVRDSVPREPVGVRDGGMGSRGDRDRAMREPGPRDATTREVTMRDSTNTSSSKQPSGDSTSTAASRPRTTFAPPTVLVAPHPDDPYVRLFRTTWPTTTFTSAAALTPKLRGDLGTARRLIEHGKTDYDTVRAVSSLLSLAAAARYTDPPSLSALDDVAAVISLVPITTSPLATACVQYACAVMDQARLEARGVSDPAGAFTRVQRAYTAGIKAANEVVSGESGDVEAKELATALLSVHIAMDRGIEVVAGVLMAAVKRGDMDTAPAEKSSGLAGSMLVPPPAGTANLTESSVRLTESREMRDMRPLAALVRTSTGPPQPLSSSSMGPGSAPPTPATAARTTEPTPSSASRTHTQPPPWKAHPGTRSSSSGPRGHGGGGGGYGNGYANRPHGGYGSGGGYHHGGGSGHYHHQQQQQHHHRSQGQGQQYREDGGGGGNAGGSRNRR